MTTKVTNQARWEKKNIAIIAGQLVVGGAEQQLYLWLSHLDRTRFQPIVLTLHPDQGDYWETQIELLNIPLLRIPHRRSQLIRLLDIVNVLRSHQPQLIHGWHLFAGPYASVAAKLLGAKSLGAVRGNFQAFCDNYLEAQLTLWFADAILANSLSTTQQLLKVRKHRHQSIYTVQNAVEDHFTSPRHEIREKLAKQFQVSLSGIWIGSLGRMDPGKRFDLILKILAGLHEDGIDFHFLLIGDGPERNHLVKMAEELGVATCVTFAGEMPHANSLLSALDIFCFTSLDEGLPNVVMEAAVAGVPVVSWQVPFMEELLEHGKGALMAEPENITAFKGYLLALIKSPELRIKMGQEGRNCMLAKFSLERYIQRMTIVYEELLGISTAIGL